LEAQVHLNGQFRHIDFPKQRRAGSGAPTAHRQRRASLSISR
jgi:hypothetical protein